MTTLIENIYKCHHKINDIFTKYDDIEKKQLDICEICYTDEKCKNIACKTCNKSLCIDCFNKLPSRSSGVVMIDETKKIEENQDKQSNIVMQYLCPWCRSENIKDLEILDKKEILKSCKKDYIDFINTNHIIDGLNDRIEKLQQENVNNSYFLKSNIKDEDIQHNIIRQNNDLKKEMAKLQDDNVRYVNENEKYRTLIQGLKNDLFTLKKERIEEYNDMVYKINETKSLLKMMSNNHEKLYDETKKLITDRKYKQVKKLYSNNITAVFTLKDIQPKKEVEISL